MKRHILLLSIFASLFISSIAICQTRLKVGDHAPELTVSRWIKGEHSFSFKKGQLYVLDFWGNSFDPQSKTVSQIVNLSDKYHDRVIFVGVNFSETTGKIASDHRTEAESSFVEKLGESMQYIVTLDNKDREDDHQMACRLG